MKKRVLILLSAMISVASVFVVDKPVFADTNATVYQKALLTGTYRCLAAGHWKSTIQAKSVTKYEQLVDKSDAAEVATPTGYGSSDNKVIDCSTLIRDHVFPAANISIPAREQIDKQKSFLESIGYKNTDSKGTCYYMNFKRSTGSGEARTADVCWDGNKLSLDTSSMTSAGADDFDRHLYFSLNPGIAGATAASSSANSLALVFVDDRGNTVEVGKHSLSVGASEKEFKKFMDQFTTDARAHGNFDWLATTSGVAQNTGVNQNKRVQYGADSKIVEVSNDDYTLKDAQAVIKKLAKAMGADWESWSDLRMSKEDKFTLLQKYMDNWFKVNIVTCDKDEFASVEGDNQNKSSEEQAIYIKLVRNGQMKKCMVTAGAHAGSGDDDKVFVFDGAMFSAKKKWTFAEVAKWMLDNGGDVELSDEQLADINTNENDEAANTEAEEDFCFGKAGALGWILCPLMSSMSDMMSSGYNDWIEPLLQTSSGVMAALQINGENGVYAAWGLFRDMANILFIIALMVVIFSQVTGFGIDNYGIKRTLPRMIIAAILVNFSFLICQLAVDASNILGSSLKDLFVYLADHNVAGGSNLVQAGIGESIKGLVGSFGFLAGVAAATFAVGMATNWAFLIAVFVTLLTSVISMFFGFVLLGARQAAIVLLVVTSPMAFILYMLPNTNNLFRRWGRLFINLLIVYPAAGLLIGGGYFAARVILTVDSDSFIFNLVGLLLLVIPYFMIIPLVRTSMNMIGNVGTKLQSMGRGLQRSAEGAAKNSQMYKSAYAKRQAGNIEGRGRWANRFKKVPVVGKAISSSMTRNLANQSEVWDAEQKRQTKAAATMDARLHPEDSDLFDRLGNAQTKDEFDMLMTRAATSNRKGTADFLSNMVRDDNFNIEGNSAEAQSNRAKVSWAKQFIESDEKMNAMLDKRDKRAGDFIHKNARNGNFKSGGRINTAYGGALSMDDYSGMNKTAQIDEMAYGAMTQQMAVDLTSDNAPPAVKSGLDAEKRAALSAYTALGTSTAAVGTAFAEASGEDKTQMIKAHKEGERELKFSNGSNIMGQAGTLKGIVPDGFNATKVHYKGDQIYLENANGEFWDAKAGMAAGNMSATVSAAGWTHAQE